MDQHFTFNNAACGFCMNGITTESGICPIPTCGLTVHLHSLIGGPWHPVIISRECGQAHAGELVVSVVKAAAHTVAGHRMEVCLTEGSAEDIAADEKPQIEHGVSEDDYEIKVLRDRSVQITQTVAEEVAKLLTELKIEQSYDQEIQKLAK